jgi:hypothetical protein
MAASEKRKDPPGTTQAAAEDGERETVFAFEKNTRECVRASLSR